MPITDLSVNIDSAAETLCISPQKKFHTIFFHSAYETSSSVWFFVLRQLSALNTNTATEKSIFCLPTGMNYEDGRRLIPVQIVHTDLPQEKQQTKWRAFNKMMGFWLRQGNVKRE